MIIHTVQPGETIYSIAENYGVSVDWLMLYNKIDNPDLLVIGRSILILYVKEIYQVQQGDSLAGIADAHGTSILQLLRNNPHLSDREYIYPGEEIIIRFTDDKAMEITTNGYAFPFIDLETLRKTLPYLTYLTIFYYRITMDGDIINIDDQEMIDNARAYGVAPVMLISTLTATGVADIEAAHSIFTDKDKQEKLIQTVLANMRAKCYYGLNVDIQNVRQEDRQLYVDFITNISSQVSQEGYQTFTTLTPNTFQTEEATMYKGPEYAIIGQVSDSTMLLSYEWGYSYSPKTALPLSSVRDLLDYAVTQIEPSKISIGLPTIGYIWEVPYVERATIANAISHDSALDLALDYGVTIQRDEASMAPFFSYVDVKEHIVWFRDSINIAVLLKFVPEYGLDGIGTWNIMNFAPGIWLVINAQFEIKKVM